MLSNSCVSTVQVECLSHLLRRYEQVVLAFLALLARRLFYRALKLMKVKFKNCLLLLMLASPVSAIDFGRAEPEKPERFVLKPLKIITTASGLKYRVLEIGSGRSVPALEDHVTIHYSGRLLDGTEFDNTRKRGRPASFAISRVIEGWSEGLQLMKEGAKYQFIVPPELAFGEKGLSGMIEPDSTLVFDVELLKVEAAKGGSKN